MKRKFLYSESRLADVTGLSRFQLKACRVRGEYRKGRGKGGPVELSERAVEGVLEKFGIKEANLDGARLNFGSNGSRARDPKQDAPIQSSVQFEKPKIWPLPDLKLVEVSQLVPNNRILKAKNGTGEIYNVIVPHSGVWAVGDPLRIKPSQTHHGYWQLEGKAPRWRGDRLYRHEFQ